MIDSAPWPSLKMGRKSIRKGNVSALITFDFTSHRMSRMSSSGRIPAQPSGDGSSHCPLKIVSKIGTPVTHRSAGGAGAISCG